MQRRDFLTTVAAAGVAATHPHGLDAAQASQKVQRKGRLKPALFRQVFGQTNMSFDEQCRIATDLGCVGKDPLDALRRTLDQMDV